MIKSVFFDFVEGALRFIPSRVGVKLRLFYYRKRLLSCGSNVVIDTGVYFQYPKKIALGNNVWIDKNVILLAGVPNLTRKVCIKENSFYMGEMGELQIDDFVHVAPNVVIQAHGGVHIGAKTGIAAGSKIYSLSHHYRNLSNNDDTNNYYFTPMVSGEEQALLLSPVVIGRGCAISLNNIVLPGTVIPDNIWFGVGMIISGGGYESDSVYFMNQSVSKKSIN